MDFWAKIFVDLPHKKTVAIRRAPPHGPPPLSRPPLSWTPSPSAAGDDDEDVFAALMMTQQTTRGDSQRPPRIGRPADQSAAGSSCSFLSFFFCRSIVFCWWWWWWGGGGTSWCRRWKDFDWSFSGTNQEPLFRFSTGAETFVLERDRFVGFLLAFYRVLPSFFFLVANGGSLN